MPTIINVKTPEQFDEVLWHLTHSEIFAFDSETNSLRPYSGDTMIGCSFYFPINDTAYYLAFRHGEGAIQLHETEETAPLPFDQLGWTGKTKKARYLAHWWNKLKPSIEFNNLPMPWLDELRAYWNIAVKSNVVVFHNALFDLGVLNSEGFDTPAMIWDTLLGLHILNEDMNGIQLNAPYTYTKADVDALKCLPEQYGDWARGTDGKLLKKLQYANKELKWFSAYLELPRATEGEQELKNAMKAFKHQVVELIGHHWDDPINASLLYANIAKKKPGAWEKYGEAQIKRFEDKTDLDPKSQMWMLPADLVAEYGALDTALTYELYVWVTARLTDWNNLDLWMQDCEVLTKLTHPMQYKGIPLDVGAARREFDRLQGMADELRGHMRYWADNAELNPGSNPQLLEVFAGGILEKEITDFPLWWDLETRAQFRTFDDWTVRDTSEETLSRYDSHPFVHALMEYRKASKGAKTYITRWLDNADGHGVIHPKFNITGTVSGRLSSSGDAGNFQNVPDRNGFRLKTAFVPPEGYSIVAIDYGQLELRLGCWVAETLLGLDNGQNIMTGLFNTGADMHAYTRDMVNVRDVVFPGMSDEAIILRLGEQDAPVGEWAKIIAKACRQIAKTMNFGLMYGGGGGMLSKLLKIDKDTATVLVNKWRKLYPAFPKANEYYQHLGMTERKLPNAQRTSFYVTQPISNRHRRFDRYALRKESFVKGVFQVWNERESQARKAFNNVIQGLGAYICLQSALRVVEKYPDVRVFAQIHDAVEMFIPTEKLSQYIPEIIGIMTDWAVEPKLTASVDVSYTNWQEMKPYEQS